MKTAKSNCSSARRRASGEVYDGGRFGARITTNGTQRALRSPESQSVVDRTPRKVSEKLNLKVCSYTFMTRTRQRHQPIGHTARDPPPCARHQSDVSISQWNRSTAFHALSCPTPILPNARAPAAPFTSVTRIRHPHRHSRDLPSRSIQHRFPAPGHSCSAKCAVCPRHAATTVTPSHLSTRAHLAQKPPPSTPHSQLPRATPQPAYRSCLACPNDHSPLTRHCSPCALLHRPPLPSLPTRPNPNASSLPATPSAAPPSIPPHSSLHRLSPLIT